MCKRALVHVSVVAGDLGTKIDVSHIHLPEICELNNPTKESSPEAFTNDSTKVYMNMFRKRGLYRVVCPKASLSLSS